MKNWLPELSPKWPASRPSCSASIHFSFDKTQFVFFTGSPAFAAKHAAAAQKAGATVIDLSGGLSASPAARPWIPALDALLPAPPAGKAPADRTNEQTRLYLSPSTPAIVACSLSAACAPLGLARLVITFFQPVSERGQAGVEELESQTVKLLSFQPMPQAGLRHASRLQSARPLGSGQP